MEIYLLSFASRCFYNRQKELVQSASIVGISKFFTWQYKRLLLTTFFWSNIRILRSKRGVGLWAWQPYIIKRSLEAVKEGDVIIFCDSGLKFNQNLQSIESILIENDITLYSAGNFTNKEYTKRDTFILMNCDSEKYWVSQQVMGGFHIWRKCKKTIDLVNEYYKYSTNYQVVSDSKNKYGTNFPDFKDHRHPQSILSLLAVRNGIKIQSCPIEFNFQQNDLSEALLKPELHKDSFEKTFICSNRRRDYKYIDRLLLKIGLWI